jgi:hypothetical protein
MTVPKPPNFDAVAWRDRLKEAIPKRPDGTPIAVWDQLPAFIQWSRTMRDVSATHEVQLADQKKDLDAHTERLNKQNDRITALENAPNVPFPASG